MGRGALFLILQLGISIGITAIGVWALARPVKLQAFIHQNFALLPAARTEWSSEWSLASTLMRIAGAALIFYGVTLTSGFKDEIVWLGAVFGVPSR
jgi:hypothetical protein